MRDKARVGKVRGLVESCGDRAVGALALELLEGGKRLSAKQLARKRAIKDLFDTETASHAVAMAELLLGLQPLVNPRPLTEEQYMENRFPEDLEPEVHVLYRNLSLVLRQLLDEAASFDEATLARLLEVSVALEQMSLLVGVQLHEEEEDFPDLTLVKAIAARDEQPGERLRRMLRKLADHHRALRASEIDVPNGYSKSKEIEVRSLELVGEYDVADKMARFFPWFASPGKLVEAAEDLYPIYDNDPYRSQHVLLEQLRRERLEKQTQRNWYKKLKLKDYPTGKAIAALKAKDAKAVMMAALCRVYWAFLEPRACPSVRHAKIAPASVLNVEVLATLLRKKHQLDDDDLIAVGSIFAELDLRGSDFSTTFIARQLERVNDDASPQARQARDTFFQRWIDA